LRNLKQAPDDAKFPILSALTGFGIAATQRPRQAMLELEILQLLASSRFETPVPDAGLDGRAVDPRTAGRLAEELLSKPGLSKELRKALGGAAVDGPTAARQVPSMRLKTSRDPSDRPTSRNGDQAAATNAYGPAVVRLCL